MSERDIARLLVADEPIVDGLLVDYFNSQPQKLASILGEWAQMQKGADFWAALLFLSRLGEEVLEREISLLGETLFWKFMKEWQNAMAKGEVLDKSMLGLVKCFDFQARCRANSAGKPYSHDSWANLKVYFMRFLVAEDKPSAIKKLQGANDQEVAFFFKDEMIADALFYDYFNAFPTKLGAIFNLCSKGKEDKFYINTLLQLNKLDKKREAIESLYPDDFWKFITIWETLLKKDRKKLSRSEKKLLGETSAPLAICFHRRAARTMPTYKKFEDFKAFIEFLPKEKINV
jgi:hypothetical protein